MYDRYLLKYTFTPEDPEEDRARKGVVVESSGLSDPLEVITLGLSKLAMLELAGQVTASYSVRLRVSPKLASGERVGWSLEAAGGTYYFEIKPFDAEDPVTKEAIAELARGQCDGSEEQTRQMLANMMGRWYWAHIDYWSTHDLKQTLHEIQMDGFGDITKPYNQQSIDELLDIIMELVVAVSDGHDEIGSGEPFGMTVMVAADRDLWYGPA